MVIIASIPYVIKKTARDKEFHVYIAVIPPVVVEDEFLTKLKVNDFKLEEACGGYDKALCYVKCFGGVAISNGKNFIHFSIEGYVHEGDKGELFSPYSFEKDPYTCYMFDDKSILCFTREKKGKMIDNIGLRLIIG
ncbi:hypothetical protein [Stygiolobus caldivivus]|uniref:Uncharacterized protein n=1 Tax=Stygiolobus caldivivus TaxID=2824673 RepID=A0A8D5U5Q4_9CREN|nr:hypothetical protein [Stygiolobus caldivivus]BCU69533.1 hypothetical protein KN1_08300 [Stygiolobus caldivivus]